MNEKNKLLLHLMGDLFEAIDTLHTKECGPIKSKCEYGNEEDDLHIIMNRTINLFEHLGTQYLDSAIAAAFADHIRNRN